MKSILFLFSILLPLTSPVHAADFMAMVTRVIDGDTFKFKTELLNMVERRLRGE